MAGSTVTTELESLSLTFSDELLDIGDSNGAFAIQVVGPDDLYYNLDCVQREGPTASASVALGESGPYEVTWQVFSSDGHPTSDTFEFVYERPTVVVAAAGVASALCRAGVSGSGATESDDRSEETEETRTVTWIWIVGRGIIALLVVSAIVVAVVGGRNRRSREPRRDEQPE